MPPPTMDIQNARYTKVGRQVTIVGLILTSSSDNTGGTGNLRISGLPFAAPAGNAGVAGNGLANASGFTANEFPTGLYLLNSQQLQLTKRAASNGALSPSLAGDLLTSASAANQIAFSLSYFTA